MPQSNMVAALQMQPRGLICKHPEETSMPDLSSSIGRNRPLSELTAGDIQDMINSAIEQRIGTLRPGGVAGSHVNSGPPGHANQPGHGNFDPPSHVNAGPPGHANEPGHANFDPKVLSTAGIRVQPEARLGNQVVTITLPDGNKVSVPETGPLNMVVGGFRITR